MFLIRRVSLMTRPVRHYSFKPIKRPDFTSKSSKAYIDNKMKEYNMPEMLRAKIKMCGPMTVASYMQDILTSPQSGYYMSRDVFGQSGDFITSPEIGQIFGELVAIWCIAEYQKVGSPRPTQIIELGPGRGTLIQDFLRVFSKFREPEDISVHLVELSPYLSKLQSQKLCYSSSEVDPKSGQRFYRVGETVTGTRVYWYQQIEDVPQGFSIILAHEFFDALPIHKLQRDGNSWKEVLVDIDTKDEKKFRFVISRNETPISKLFSQLRPEETRNHVEISPLSDLIATNIANRLESDGGFGLVMDYGHTGDKEDTFRAFKSHKLHDPLEDPGTADVTADVDFKNLRNMLETDDKLIVFGPIEQGEFLKNMHAEARLEQLLSSCPSDKQESLKSGYEMLVSPEQMGKRFKFFSFFPSVLKEHLRKFPVTGF